MRHTERKRMTAKVEGAEKINVQLFEEVQLGFQLLLGYCYAQGFILRQTG